MTPEPNARISDSERLSRFVFTLRYFRANGTVKPNAWMPARDNNTSVTQSSQMQESDLLRLGCEIGQLRGMNLYGRADVAHAIVRGVDLLAVPEPVAGNPNHANITGWPDSTDARLMKAAKIASRSTVSRVP